MNHAQIHRGPTFPVPPNVYNAPIAPALGNAHQWVATQIHRISQTAVDNTVAAWMNGVHADGLELDHENLVSVTGPTCLKCHQDLTPEIHARPCPIQVVPILGIAR